jgi:hypothetical protein
MLPEDLAVSPAPEPEVTATPAPEVDAKPVEPIAAAKVFTQEELDAAIGKRLAREARKWERERAQAQVQPSATTPVVPPNVADFSDAPAYAEALATSRAEEIVAKRQAERDAVALRDSYEDRAEAARDRYDDFEQVAYNPAVPVSQTMAEAVMADELGPEILYHLGSHPSEAARIARLAPVQQAREIGKLSAKLASTPPAKTTSSAPAPITPVAARNGAAKVVDTTDPRAAKSMSDSEWINAENERVRKRLEANRNR